jgi:hypothetical protein
LRLAKRFGRLSVVRNHARVAASVVDASAGEEIEADGIAVGGIVVDGTRVLVRLVVVRRVARVDGIRGWIRCGSGLLLVERGRVLHRTRWWI